MQGEMTTTQVATTQTPLLEVSGLGHTYGAGQSAHKAIDEVSFVVHRAELVSIVGPSGAGKSTLLRCISGLMPAACGTVSLLGETVSGVPEGLAMVFQDYSRSLFPWKRVAGNVGFPLRGAGSSKQEREARVQESLRAVGLEDAANRYPWQLSGGMQQRVAIARALACRPTVLLMDEPFASVDAQTRSDLEDLVMRVNAELGVTILFVTHDIDESVYISDRVLVLSPPPTRLLATLPVDLPRPRDQIETKESPEFIHLRSEVTRLVRRSKVAAD